MRLSAKRSSLTPSNSFMRRPMTRCFTLLVGILVLSLTACSNRTGTQRPSAVVTCQSPGELPDWPEDAAGYWFTRCAEGTKTAWGLTAIGCMVTEQVRAMAVFRLEYQAWRASWEAGCGGHHESPSPHNNRSLP